MKRIIPVLGLVVALPLAACSEDDGSPLGLTEFDSTFEAPAPESSAAPAPGDVAIAQIAVEAGFTELVGALSYVDSELGTGLVELFANGTDQYTVFAPTNDAFFALYGLLGGILETTVDEITDLPAETVLDVLLYHVTDGRRAANSVVPPRRERVIQTLLGESFRVRTDATIVDGLTGIRPDDAAIAPADISASNGIVHVIDEVLVPPTVAQALLGPAM